MKDEHTVSKSWISLQIHTITIYKPIYTLLKIKKEGFEVGKSPREAILDLSWSSLVLTEESLSSSRFDVIGVTISADSIQKSNSFFEATIITKSNQTRTIERERERKKTLLSEAVMEESWELLMLRPMAMEIGFPFSFYSPFEKLTV